MEQGSVEWKMARVGKVTASRIADVMAKVKVGEAAAREDYRAQLVAEILTGEPADDGYVSKDMQFGVEQEPFARAAYEVSRGAFIDQVGIVDHPTIERFAASPDGLIDDDGLVEIKCPKIKTHLKYLISGKVPGDYFYQMQGQLSCTGRKWCDWVSFRPELPEHLRLLVIRVARDDTKIKEIEEEIVKFNTSVDKLVRFFNKEDNSAQAAKD